MKIRQLFLILITNLVLTFSLYSQQIDVQVILIPPYSNQLDDYFHDLDKMIITITNLSSSTQNVNLKFDLFRNGNLFAKVKKEYKITQPLILSPNEIRVLTGNELDQAFSAFSIDNMDHTMTAEEQFNLNVYKILPEGYYDLCVNAFDYITDQRLSEQGGGRGCAGFTIMDGIPAEIIYPTDNSNIPNLDIGISWSPAVSDVSPFFDYTLEIRDVTNLPVSREDASKMTQLLIFQKTIENNVFYAYDFDGSDPDLLENHTYQIDLISKDSKKQLKFKNNGYAASKRFTIKKIVPPGSINLEAAYPLMGDTLPFEYISNIVKYSPYSNNYTKYEFNYVLKDEKNNLTYARKDDNKWPHGPLHYLQKTFPGATEFEAQHLPLNKRADQETAIGNMIKGLKYRWLVASKMTDNGAVKSLPNIDAFFIYGMTKPQLKFPPDKEKYASEGDITLKWKAGTMPKNPFPPFKGIANIKNNNAQQQFLGEVNEVWVMQLASSKDFKQSSLTYCKAGQIHFDPEAGNSYDKSELEKNVYPDIDYVAKNLKENKYYWRIVYLSDKTKYNAIQNKNKIFLQPNEYYISSPIREFEISKDTGTGTLAQCGNCELEDIDDTYGSYPVKLSILKTYSKISVGGFEITNIKNLKSSGTNTFNGTGEVKIPFLNDIKIKVNLKNIKVNSRQKIFEGTVEATSTTKSGVDIAKSAWDKIKMIKDMIKGGGDAHDIPVGIDYKISGVDLKVGITKIKFTAGKKGTKPTIRGVMDVMTYVEVPGYTNGWVNMAASDICFNNTGIGSEFLLHPYNDIDLTAGGSKGYQLLIKGFKNKTIAEIKKNSSYLEFDCSGWKSFALRGEVRFSRNALVPDIESTGKAGQDTVKGTFGVQFDKNHQDPNGSTFKNWIAHVDMDPFQINGLEGWGFVIKDAYLDNSDLVNPPGITFPKNYHHSALNDPATINTWGGFYLKEIGIRLPKELLGKSNRAEVSLLKDMIIDKTGKLTAFIGVKDLIDVKTGELGGWAFALDKLGLQIISNELTSCDLEGRLGLPLTHKDEYLTYGAYLQKDKTDKYKFIFNVKPQDKLHFELFVAMATLEKNSIFSVEVSSTTKVNAALHGTLMIGDENAEKKINIPGFKLPGAKFDLTYDNENGFTEHNFSFSSPQKKIQGFPATIKDIKFEGDLKNAKLKITPALSLAGKNKAFSAAARLVFEAKIDIGEKNFSLDKVTLDSIGIKSEFSGFSLEGALTWYDETKNGTQVKGIKGALNVKIPIGVEVALNGEFGTLQNKGVSNPTFGTTDYYSYWYLDGLVSFPGTGLVLASGVNLMALGGGFGYNMELDNSKYYKYNNLSNSMKDLSNAPQQKDKSKKPDTIPKSKSVYVPAFNNYICKFSAKIGQKPTYEVFASLTIAFNKSENGLGLKAIKFYGNAIFLPEEKQKVSPGSNYIAAEAMILYDNQNKIFNAEFDVYANISNVIKGGNEGTSENGAFKNRVVKAVFHFEEKKWYVKIGTYKNRASLKVSVPPALKVDFSSYLMFGYEIPTYLPELPKKIQDLLGIGKGKGKTEGNELEGTKSGDERKDRNNNDEMQYLSGEGLAFGAAAEINYSLDAGIVYAKFWAALGFDINITHSNQIFCSSPDGGYARGKNGWYGQGQVYAGLGGSLGVRVWFFKTYEIDILSLSAAVALSGGFPNPNWFDGRAGVKYSVLGGMVSGHANFQMTIGEKCKFTSPNPFGITFIKEIEPQGKDVSVLSNIKTTFSLPVNKIYEIPKDLDDPKKGVRKLAPVIFEYDVFEKQTKQNLTGTITMEAENTISLYHLDKYLKAQTEYVAEIILRGRECPTASCDESDISSWPFVKENNSNNIYEEIKRDTFKTGDYPKTLDPFIDYSRPIKNQNFLTSEDEVNKTGLIYYRGTDKESKSMNTDMFNNYFPEKDEKGNYYYYIAKYIPKESKGSSIEVPIARKKIKNVYLEYNRNAKLEQNIIYECRIERLIQSEDIVKMNPKKSKMELVGKYNDEKRGISAEQYTDKSKVVHMKDVEDKNVVSHAQLNQNTIGMIDNANNIPMPDYDKYYYSRYILYKYDFKTSKYPTLKDKIDAVTLNYHHNISGGCTYQGYYNTPSSCDGIDDESVDIEIRANERFDMYDLYGNAISVFKEDPNSPYDVVKYENNTLKYISFDPGKLKDIKYPPNVIITDPFSSINSDDEIKTTNKNIVLNYRIQGGYWDDKKILHYVDRSTNNNNNRSRNNWNKRNNKNNNENWNGSYISKPIVLKLRYFPVHDSNINLPPVQGDHQEPNSLSEFKDDTKALNNYPGKYSIAFNTISNTYRPVNNFSTIYNSIPAQTNNSGKLDYPIYRKFMDKPYKKTGIMPVWSLGEMQDAADNMNNKFNTAIGQYKGMEGPGAGLGVGGGIFTGGGSSGFGGNGLGGGQGGGTLGQMIGAMGGMH